MEPSVNSSSEYPHKYNTRSKNKYNSDNSINNIPNNDSNKNPDEVNYHDLLSNIFPYKKYINKKAIAKNQLDKTPVCNIIIAKSNILNGTGAKITNNKKNKWEESSDESDDDENNMSLEETDTEEESNEDKRTS